MSGVSDVDVWLADTSLRVSLCCVCGDVRSVSSAAAVRGHYGGEADSPEHIAEMIEHFRDYGKDPALWEDTEPWVRCVELLKCRTCGRVTRHAFIGTDAHRNWCEDEDHKHTHVRPRGRRR